MARSPYEITLEEACTCAGGEGHASSRARENGSTVFVAAE